MQDQVGHRDAPQLQPAHETGRERPARTRHLRTPGHLGVRRPVAGQRPGPPDVGVADRLAVLGQPAAQGLGRGQLGGPQPRCRAPGRVGIEHAQSSAAAQLHHGAVPRPGGLPTGRRLGHAELHRPCGAGVGERQGRRATGQDGRQVDLDRFAVTGDAGQGGGQRVGDVAHQQVPRTQHAGQVPGPAVLERAPGLRDEHPDPVPGHAARLGRGRGDTADRQRVLGQAGQPGRRQGGHSTPPLTVGTGNAAAR